MDTAGRVHVRDDADDLPADQQIVDELSELLGGIDGFEALAERLALLGDPRRLQILFCIHAHPGVRSSDIARAIGAPISTTSHALALLRRAGWVAAARTGREVRYDLADELAHRLLHELGSDHLPAVRHHDDRPHRHG